MYEKQESSWSFAIGLFVGALAGAAAASVLSPRSGQQNREAVTERGVVLKTRMTDRATAVSTSVKDTTSSALETVKETTSSAVATVKDTTSSAIETVKGTTNSALETVKETTSSVVATVKDTAATVKDKASDVAGKISETASATVEKVQGATSSAVSKVQDVAGTATDKARSLTGRADDEIVIAEVTTPVQTLAAEANYDAEDVRPVAASSATASLPSADALKTLHEIDTFEPTATASEPGTLNDVLPSSALSAGIGSDVVGSSTLAPDQIAAVNEAVAELSSAEQFEITDVGATLADEMPVQSRTVAGTDADVREASEGADRTT